MAQLIAFRRPINRKDYKFITQKTKIKLDNGTYESFPTIAIIKKSTGEIVCYTLLEKYVINLLVYDLQNSQTMYKKAYAVADFCNYLLENTSITHLSEISLKHIQNYLTFISQTHSADLWSFKQNAILSFLLNYYKYNNEKFDFNYNGATLFDYKVVKNSNGRPIVLTEANLFATKPPKKKLKKKFRGMKEDYLKLLIYEAKKYDPELALAIALQAYAGLREGEVVNLNYQRVQIVRGGFCAIKKIKLDLTSPAPHAQKWDATHKDNFGSIKNLRVQEVYTSFLDEIDTLLSAHMARAESLGRGVDANDPIFHNSTGNPLTQKNYCIRLKNLFYKYFLPDLIFTSTENGTYAEEAPYIEEYEKDYPGAHMLRHWFTMYLLKQRLQIGEIARWRGDSSDLSMQDYIHINDGLIKEYEKASYVFQAELLEEMND